MNQDERISVKRRKKMAGYVEDGIRCTKCIGFRPPLTRLTTNSQTQQSLPWCTTNAFAVKPYAYCDKWEDKQGNKIAPLTGEDQ